MRTATDRTRGVTLTTIDLSTVLAEIPVGWNETATLGFEPYALIEHDGTLYVVCGEGVGWEVTTTNPLPLDIYVSTPGHIAMFPRYQALLTPDEIRALPTGAEIDLADLVRVFGARLESNFASWHRALTA